MNNLNQAQLDAAGEKRPGAAGARVCDPQRVASRTNVGDSFQAILAIHVLRLTEPRSVNWAVTRRK